MNTNAKVLEDLQTSVSMEMAAVHQYMLHAHILDIWGLVALDAKMRCEMAEELSMPTCSCSASCSSRESPR